MPDPFTKWWVRSATETALRVKNGARLIFATMSPFQSAEVACRLSRTLGVPWVADLRDPWALDEMRVYPTLLHRRVEMKRMERLLSSASVIVMNTPEATAALKAAFPRLQSKPILTITNGFDAEDFAAPVPLREDPAFRIVHSGYLHTGDGLRLRGRTIHRLFGGMHPGVDILTRSHAILLEAVERWCSTRPGVRQDLEIVFAGETSPADRQLADRSAVRSLIRFTSYIPHRDSVDLIRTANLLFLPMHNLPPGTRSQIVPGKT
jgi:hypothetical protein